MGRLLAKQTLPPPEYEGAVATWRRVLNHYRLSWEWYRIAPVLRSYPSRLCIESTGACNLRCPHCFTGAGDDGRPRQMLSLNFYRQLLAELGPRLWQVEFHNWGEPMLNPHLATMVGEATALGLSTSLCTNFSLPFDTAKAEALVSAGLKLMGVSIDGASQSVYEQYRVRGDIGHVLQNCRLMADTKRRLGMSTPRMIWGYHVFRHNQDEVERARGMARDLGMDFHVSRGRVVGEDWDPAEERMRHDSVAPVPCYTLFHTAVVYADGSVAPCRGTFQREDDLGRVSADGGPGAATFREAWNQERFRLARELFARRREHPEDPRHICSNCPANEDWHHYAGWVALGGAPDAWRPPHDSNQRFNYFWSRKGVHDVARTAGGSTSPAPRPAEE